MWLQLEWQHQQARKWHQLALLPLVDADNRRHQQVLLLLGNKWLRREHDQMGGIRHQLVGHSPMDDSWLQLVGRSQKDDKWLQQVFGRLDDKWLQQESGRLDGRWLQLVSDQVDDRRRPVVWDSCSIAGHERNWPEWVCDGLHCQNHRLLRSCGVGNWSPVCNGNFVPQWLRLNQPPVGNYTKDCRAADVR